MTKPTMDAVQHSSNIEFIGYDPEAEELWVTFKGGALYAHEAVPQKVYDEFKDSTSKGKFYHARIKGRYRTRKETE